MMKPRFSGKISDRKLIETFKQSSTVKILSGQGFSDRLLLLFSDFLTQHPMPCQGRSSKSRMPST
ncbi:hypothetical protein [Nostoc sp. FACHB-888]|uniref:hypothetical protein n=1 Tax=Nostoc sp. FACHB-888 TaxID=2692842 RepID=UPI0016858DCC|nr:hypothetical protein [Nostoc sp. FACHB-888]MBD2247293.1 hypothetical protein [Nostoc sp. FACHB-888]